MKIPNPFRRWFRKRVQLRARYEGSSFSRDRSWLPGLTQDAFKDITEGDRLELMRRARYFEKNSPLVQQILDLIEQNVVGTGVNPTPGSSNPEYNKKALAAWNDWCKFADNTSRQHFYTLEAIIARAQATDGEIFCWLTEGESGRPRVQLFEAHRVKSPTALPAPYDKFINVDGILIDERGRPQAYCVENTVTVSDSVRAGSVTILPAEKFVHFFEPSRASQYRGITLFHAALITLHDLDDLQRYEMLAAKDAASKSNIVKTATGEIEDDGSIVGRSQRVTKDDGSEEQRRTYYENAFGGKTVVLKHGDDYKQSESLRPSAAMRDFWEYLTEQVCRAIGISYAAIKNYQGWSGAALRGAITSDNRFYEVRTASLVAGLQRIWEYVIGWHNDKGELGAVPADWFKVRWQPPRRATVDIGRESAALLNELRAGVRSYRDILGEQGQDWQEVLRQRAEEEAFIDQLAADKKIDRSRIAALGPNERAPVSPTMNPDQTSGVTAVHAHSPSGVIAFLNTTSQLDVPCEMAAALPTSFVWMPAGTHDISAGSPSGETWKGRVLCDEKGAAAVIRDFNASLAQGRRVWIDFNHEDAEAAAWVKGFSWDPARGIVCHVEWTAEGEESLREKSYYSFSPAFLVDRESGRVSGLIIGHAAGGLVNAPAFGAAMPALIAARLGGADSNNPAPGGSPGNQKPNTVMKEILIKILAALAVTHAADATEDQLQALVASNITKVKPSEDLAKLQAELEAVKASAKKAETELAEVKASKAKETPAVVIVAPGVQEVEASKKITAKPNPIEAVKAMQKERDPRKRGAIFCADVRSLTSQRGVLEVLAANSLGSMAADLVVLRALDLLKLRFPMLSAITTDFSSESAKLNQDIVTRLITVPTVGTYDANNGYVAGDAGTTDVSIKIDAHKHVTISFGVEELGSTNRDLFGEQVEAMHYALGKDLVDAIYALLTLANFDLAAQKTTKALATFDRKTVAAMAKAMNARGVSMRRALLLNSDYFEALSNDSTILNLAAYQKPEVIEEYVLPRVSGFQPYEAVNLPANAVNLVAAGLAPDALAIATRLPADYMAALPGSSNGSSSVVTNPDTGISVQKVDFVDHKMGKANSRIAWMRGAGVGQKASAQLLVSA